MDIGGLFDKFSASVWPVITSNPGVSLSLIGIGLVVGWLARWLLNRERIANLTIQMGTSTGKVEIADRHKALVEAQLAEVTIKHTDLSAKLESAFADVRRLMVQVSQGASADAISNTSASVNKNVAVATLANTDLTTSISSLSLGFGGANDMLWLGGGPRYAPIPYIGATNPPTSSPPSPAPPKSPTRK